MKKLLCVIFSLGVSYASSINYEKSNNIVIDDKNKIMWQDNTEVTNYLETLTSAKVYCNILVLNGYIDWKMPTIKEMQNIVDVSERRSIDKNFKYLKPNIYITNTVFKNNENEIWAIDFSNGKTILVSKTKKNYIRCVRDIK